MLSVGWLLEETMGRLGLLARTQTLFYFSFRSFRKHRRACERSERARKKNKELFTSGTATSGTTLPSLLWPALWAVGQGQRGSAVREINWSWCLRTTIPSSSWIRASSRDPLRPPGVVSDTHGITKLHSALSAMLITLFLLSRLSQCTATEMIPTIISMVGIISVAVQPNAPLSLHPVAADRGEI